MGTIYLLQPVNCPNRQGHAVKHRIANRYGVCVELTSHLPADRRAHVGTASQFAALFSEALIITPQRLHA
jgi:hypothetical protein